MKTIYRRLKWCYLCKIKTGGIWLCCSQQGTQWGGRVWSLHTVKKVDEICVRYFFFAWLHLQGSSFPLCLHLSAHPSVNFFFLSCFPLWPFLPISHLLPCFSLFSSRYLFLPSPSLLLLLPLNFTSFLVPLLHLPSPQKDKVMRPNPAVPLSSQCFYYSTTSCYSAPRFTSSFSSHLLCLVSFLPSHCHVVFIGLFFFLKSNPGSSTGMGKPLLQQYS